MEEVKILKRHVTAAAKKRVAGIQRFTYAGNVFDYKCPLNGLPFDESGYDIDHIKPLCEGGTNETSNLQALCLMCHRVKSNRRSSEVLKEKPKTVKKEVVKKVNTPIVEKPPPITKKSYSFCHTGERKEFSDLDQMMKCADQIRADKKWTDTDGWEYEIRIPIGERIIVQKEFFPRFSNPAVRSVYNLGPWS